MTNKFCGKIVHMSPAARKHYFGDERVTLTIDAHDQVSRPVESITCVLEAPPDVKSEYGG